MNQKASHQIISGRMMWLDFLRLAAGFSIIGMHASSDPNGLPFPDFDTAQRVAPALFRAVVYIARSELFWIISLFLLCLSLEQRPRSYGTMVRQQAKRLLLPFVFWVFFYAYYRLIKAHYFGYDAAIWAELSSGWSWLRYFILGSVQYHMHFLPTLFGLALMVPLFLYAVRNPWLGLLVFLCLFVKREADVWMWANLRDMDGFPYLVRAVKILTYGGYGMVAGSFLGLCKQGMDQKRLKDWLVFALISSVLLFSIKLIYTYKVIMAGNWQYNYTPAFWADFLMPILLFLICMSAGLARWPTFISKIGKYSFGLFLMHPIFLDGLEILMANPTLSPGAYVLIKFSAALTMTALAVWIVSKIPLLAWTIGLGDLPFSTKLSGGKKLGVDPQL